MAASAIAQSHGHRDVDDRLPDGGRLRRPVRRIVAPGVVPGLCGGVCRGMHRGVPDGIGGRGSGHLACNAEKKGIIDPPFSAFTAVYCDIFIYYL